MKPYELVLTNRSVDNRSYQLLDEQGQGAYLKGDFESSH